jgi:hypothetical protein
MSTLTVGAGGQYKTLASAVAASHDGDVLQVKAGTYTNDFAEITHKITIEGVGGMVNLVASGQIPNGKAILITDTDVTLDHIAFSGATVRDGNGAGIRYQGGNLTITNSYFHNNQNGILGAADPNGTITIDHSEFDHNGSGTGKTHNMYIGDIKQFTLTNSYTHDAVVGHEIKSRAANNTITDNRILDNSGSASYEIDLPNGGNAVIKNNVIQQSAQSQNPTIIAYGEEGMIRASNSVSISGNTIINDKGKGVAFWNAGGGAATFAGNKVEGFGGGALVTGSAAQSGTMVMSARPPLNTASPIGASTVPAAPPAPPPVTPKPPVTPAPVTPKPPVTPAPVTTPGTTINLTGNYYGTISNATLTEAGKQLIWVGVGGSHNTVSLAANDGWLYSTGDNNVLKFTGGGGKHILTSTGSGNTIDAGTAMTDTITDNGKNNTIVLHAGKGVFQQLLGAILTNGDVLDVRSALGTTNWNGSASTVGSYLTTASTNGGHDTTLLLSSTAGGAGVAFATIHNTGTVSTASVMQHVKVA